MSEQTIPCLQFSQGNPLDVLTRGCADLFDIEASDIRIQSDDFVFAYVNRQWVKASDRRLDDGELRNIVGLFYRSHSAQGLLGEGKPLDFELTLQPDPHHNPDRVVRCRANITRSRVGNVSDGLSIVLRTIPGLPRKWETLGMEEEITENFFPSKGLVLVIGVTGSGKSTILSSSVRYRIEELRQPVAVGSFEDPIEFIYPRLPSGNMPEVSQVDVKTHLNGFGLVSPNVLRRKFDVVLVGEMRDRESVETAILISDTGHATYGTLHADTPATAFARVIAEFPYDSQPSIANKLLDNTRLVVAQKIVRTTQGLGKAYRSWCVFDRALKDRMNEKPHFEWSRILREHMQERGTAFENRALPDFRAGLLDMDGYMTVSGMGLREARAYLEAHP